MARFDMGFLDESCGGVGGAPMVEERFYDLGMRYATGSVAAVDLVAAHMWFNIAAMRGHAEARRLRAEIAEQMDEQQVAAAQRAARDWLKSH